MADNFDFAALAKSWQQQATPTESLPNAEDLAKACQRQRRQRWLMYSEWLGAAVMAIAACWLWFSLAGWLGILSAVFLLCGALSTLYVSWQVHRPILAYDNWSSNGLLQFRCRACQLTLRYYRYTQLSCAALVIFTAALWLLHWWQPEDISATLLQFYTLIISPLCVLAIYKLEKKYRQKAIELHQLMHLTKDFQPSE